MIKIHDLKPAAGSTKAKKRVGRGIGGKGGKTAGRGTKGQHARNTVARGFEGGQTPLHRKAPKMKGFNNPFRVEYQAVNLDVVEAAFEAGAVVAPDTMRAAGLVHKNGLVKLLGRGEVTKSLTVRVHAVSASAKAAIEAAGGTVEVLPTPWGDRRPPARGNQHANR
jgi:large subunit ribosomal protein L15